MVANSSESSPGHVQPDPPRRRIALIPLDSPENAYVSRMRGIFSRFGQVEAYEGRRASTRRLIRGDRWKYDLIVVNWMENLMVSNRSGRLSFKGILKLVRELLAMRLVARRLVFFRHNNYPHALAPGQRRLGWRLVDLFEACFDVVFSHSGAHLSGRRHYCPHPLYVEHPESEADSLGGGLPTKPYLVAFGRILPYKKIENLVGGFPPNWTLVVAGALGDRPYLERLQQAAAPNVHFRAGYLSEAEAQALLRNSEGIVLSHADEDVVVSGSFFYAMSLGCRVFAVETPFLRWVQSIVGEDLLILGSDSLQVCRQIEAAGPWQKPDTAERRVSEAFGDEAIHACLQSALDF